MVKRIRTAHVAFRGFTIVELLIVIVIISILAVIVTVGYRSVTSNANNAALQTDITRLADEIKLISLDDGQIPNGGATSSSTGDSTILPGVRFKSNSELYDATVSNLFYCNGEIGGAEEFALAARSKSGKAFSYVSNVGMKDFNGYTWSTSNNGIAVCTALGFTAPFTWSYGYSTNANYGWLAWAFGGEYITNYATNPSVEVTGGWYSNNGAAYPATRTTAQKRTGSYSMSSYNLSSSTALLSVYAAGGSDGNGVPIAHGGTYTASVYFRADVANQGRVGHAYQKDGVWSATTYGGYVTGTTNSWTKASHSLFVPEGADLLRSIVVVYSLTTQPSGVTAYIDDYVMTDGPETPGYADGNSIGWEWEGATNGSASTGPPKD